jgi:hypothetical protein
MTGAGYRNFTAGAVLTAAQVNTFLMEQSVMNFAGTAARGSALASVLSAGQMAHVGGGTVTVYDGSAWQQVYPAASAGLVFVAGTAFSAVSSVSVNNCFTSTYDNYRIVLAVSAGTSSISPQMRLRAAATDNSSNNYYFQGTYYSTTSLTAPTANRSAGLTNKFGTGDVTSNHCYAVIDVIGPQSSTYLTGVLWNFIANGLTDSVTSCGAGRMSVTTSYDGFTYFDSSGGAGTMTGSVRVYGYRNS